MLVGVLGTIPMGLGQTVSPWAAGAFWTTFCFALTDAANQAIWQATRSGGDLTPPKNRAKPRSQHVTKAFISGGRSQPLPGFPLTRGPARR